MVTKVILKIWRILSILFFKIMCNISNIFCNVLTYYFKFPSNYFESLES